MWPSWAPVPNIVLMELYRSELRSCVQVDVAVVGYPFLIVLMVSVGGRKATFQKKKTMLYTSATTLWCPGYPRLVGVVAIHENTDKA